MHKSTVYINIYEYTYMYNIKIWGIKIYNAKVTTGNYKR